VSRSSTARGLAGDASERGHSGGGKREKARAEGGAMVTAPCREAGRVATRRSELGVGALRGRSGALRGEAAGGGERKLRVASGEGGRGKLMGGARALAAPG
jgi:hypothetical protein